MSVSRRVRFVIEKAYPLAGKKRLPVVLNLGVGDDIAALGASAVHADMDAWVYPWFVQCDLHHLPFRDGTFEMVVLGDVIEHLVDPALCLQEAKRVGRQLVVTIFEEWRLPGPGQHIEAGHETFGDNRQEMERYIAEGRVKSVIPESVLSHNPHIWQFTDDDIQHLVDGLGMKVLHFSKEPEWMHEGHIWYCWLIHLERS